MVSNNVWIRGRKSLINLQEPKAERRRVFDELKETMAEWSLDFTLSTTNINFRRLLRVVYITLLVVFASVVVFYAIRPILIFSSTNHVENYIRSGLAMALFVSFAVYYVSWENYWFKRSSDEELRLKRMILDVRRAHWFVELAFQWQDEFKEAVPPEIVDRLTKHLFAEHDSEDHPQHPYEALGSALLGVSGKVKVGPSGVEAEIDRKGMKQLKSDGT